MTTTDRMPNESAPAYEAFRAYCQMGGKRTTRAVARKLRKSATIIQRWSRTHGWKVRSALWDNEQAHGQQNATEQAELEAARKIAARRLEVQDRAWEIAQQLIEKAKDMLKFPVGRQERTESDGGKTITTIAFPARWTFGDVSRIVTAADALSRLACGMATGKQELSGPDDKPFTMPTQTAPTQLVIRVTHGDETDRARAIFGDRPDGG